jgi:hypothetical protein
LFFEGQRDILWGKGTEKKPPLTPPKGERRSGIYCVNGVDPLCLLRFRPYAGISP